MQLEGRPALLYVVFEHQSTEDPKMPLRMLRYVLGVWSEYLKLHPATRTLPPVIPCVLHHGPAPWKLEQTLGPPGTEALMAKMSTVQRMTKEGC